MRSDWIRIAVLTQASRVKEKQGIWHVQHWPLVYVGIWVEKVEPVYRLWRHLGQGRSVILKRGSDLNPNICGRNCLSPGISHQLTFNARSLLQSPEGGSGCARIQTSIRCGVWVNMCVVTSLLTMCPGTRPPTGDYFQIDGNKQTCGTHLNLKEMSDTCNICDCILTISIKYLEKWLSILVWFSLLRR